MQINPVLSNIMYLLGAFSDTDDNDDDDAFKVLLLVKLCLSKD